jgi:hypothetical protein
MGEYPAQRRTGRRGYFGKAGSVSDRSHKTNSEPRGDSTRRANWQVAQRPDAPLLCVLGVVATPRIRALRLVVCYQQLLGAFGGLHHGLDQRDA